MGRGSNPRPYSVLKFESDAKRSSSPAGHLDDLLQRLHPAADALRAFAEDERDNDPQHVPLRLWLHIEARQAEVGIDISDQQLKVIAELGAWLAVEVEFVTDDED